jgi:hypothetical protein
LTNVLGYAYNRSIKEKEIEMNKNKEWLVTGIDYSGVTHKVVVSAWYGHPAITFAQKKLGIVFRASSATLVK